MTFIVALIFILVFLLLAIFATDKVEKEYDTTNKFEPPQEWPAEMGHDKG